MRLFLLLISMSTVSYAHPGVGIVEDSKGNIFFTDLKQVWKIDLNGKKMVVVPSVHTHELLMDNQDNLYGEHLWYNGESKGTWGYYVWKLNPAGKVQKVIPDTEGFREDYSFVQDEFGNMFRAGRDNSCQKLLKGKSDRYLDFGGKCYHNIRFMAVSKNNEVLVVDFQDVIKIDQQGNPKIIATQIADPHAKQSTSSNQNSVLGIWDDNHGNIYTAIYSNRLIKKFSPSGKQEVAYRSVFPWAPSGGLISSKDELWVLEGSVLNNVRVVHVLSNGEKKSF